LPEDVAASPNRRLVRHAIGVLLIVVLFLLARSAREKLGLEWSAESIQSTVERLGILAPAGYLVLVTGRQLLALPSVIVLTAAGLLFGAPLGSLLGGIGITLNALVLFGTARLMGRDWVLPRLEARYPDFEERARSAGPTVIALMTGHPMGILTPFHFAAGVTRMSTAIFLLAVCPAAIFRAACYSFLGANLLDPGSLRFWIATGVLVVAALLPLAHPGVRARILRRK
jgi:uncharacterized membrane protein YdjX (TVP38/TMEM64 family)